MNNLKPKSPVRIAGVEVGKVKKIEAVESGSGAARVTMEIEERGLPIHEDAELKIRPRIFLEGNFFVDLEPGSPSGEELAKGDTIPVTQTAAPVQIGDVLTALQKDTREDLQTFLREYSEGLVGRRRRGLQRRPSTTGSPPTATRRSPTTPRSASIPTATCSACSTASSRPSRRSTTTSAR